MATDDSGVAKPVTRGWDEVRETLDPTQSLVWAFLERKAGQSHSSQLADDTRAKQGRCKNQGPGAQLKLELTGVDEDKRKLRNTSPFGRAQFFAVASYKGMCPSLPPNIMLPLVFEGPHLTIFHQVVISPAHTFLVLTHFTQLSYPLSSDKSVCFGQTELCEYKCL